MALDLNYPLTRYLYRPVSRLLAERLSGTAITPLELTFLSAVLIGAGGAAFVFDAFVVGAALALVGQIADCADGDLARITGRTSASGAFLDSVLDRWTDAALILGLGFSDLDRYGAVATLALVGSFLVSYTRARALSLGVDCPAGIATRDFRLLIVMIAALTGLVAPGLWLIAVSSIVTSVTRAISTTRALGRTERG